MPYKSNVNIKNGYINFDHNRDLAVSMSNLRIFHLLLKYIYKSKVKIV